MMWGFALIFFCAQKQVMSQETRVDCPVYYDLPPCNDTTPSTLAALSVEKVTVNGQIMVNISWTISIDASIEYLTGTLIKTGQASYLCTYNPHLVNDTASKQKEFNLLVKPRCGFVVIQATNVPLPPRGSGPTYKSKMIEVECPPPPVKTQSTQVPTTLSPVLTTTSPLGIENITGIISGGLIGLMILASCYIIYKNYGASIAKSFERLPQSPVALVPVLIVYPAESSVFQQAVVALAEFLQWHGGCSVAIDMWQQGKIAELGPMRWLAQQAKAAERVLIVCPQPSQSTTTPICSVSQPCISAASQDLYPLVLNMVAGQAKSTSDLNKFWVVQLAVQQQKRPWNLALELKGCKMFCLMKDLKKLYRNLHTNRKDEKKISELILRPTIPYSEKSTLKLAEAVKEAFPQR